MATQPPHGVGQAITAIWISLAVSALSALAGKLMGLSTQDEFITSLIAYATLCIFPYKLGNGIIGLDVEVARFATFSDGRYVAPADSFRKYEERLRRYQRALNA